MTSITVNAPAKVNLFLKILNKRPDGYHNILTLFERISLADRITITKIQNGIDVVSDKFIVRNSKDNLVYKAARLLLSAKKIKTGVRIRIKKNIPIAAGLGGGSSDAAAVLAGMNRIFGLRMKRDDLMRLGRRLGADVPFFLLDKPYAIGRSRGDRLNSIIIRQKLWHLIIYPGFRLTTKDIYEGYDAARGYRSKRLTLRHGSGSSPELLSKGLTRSFANDKIGLPLEGPLDFGGLRTMLHNDLEKIAVSKRKVVGRIIERLATSSTGKAILSGSGPSVFCLYRTRREAMKAKIKFLRNMPAGSRKDRQIFIARTLD